MEQQAQQFDAKEIADAQWALDMYPDASPFWDAEGGQDVLYVAKRAGLKSNNTNAERIAAYREWCEAEEAAETDHERGERLSVRMFPEEVA